METPVLSAAKHAAYDGEYRGVRPDAESGRQERKDGESWVPPQQPQAEAEIVSERARLDR